MPNPSAALAPGVGLSAAAARDARAAADHADYASFAALRDPVGNSWLLHEITTRLPGR